MNIWFDRRSIVESSYHRNTRNCYNIFPLMDHFFFEITADEQFINKFKININTRHSTHPSIQNHFINSNCFDIGLKTVAARTKALKYFGIFRTINCWNEYKIEILLLLLSCVRLKYTKRLVKIDIPNYQFSILINDFKVIQIRDSFRWLRIVRNLHFSWTK